MADPIRDFEGDANGEWVTLDGDFSVVAGAAAVPQGISIRVGMFLGECYLDEQEGIDYPNVILIKNPDPLVVRGVIQAQIVKTPDVTNVVGADLLQENATREASIAYSVDTVYSEQPLFGQIGVP